MLNIFVTRKIPEQGLQKLMSAGFGVMMSDKKRALSKREIVKELKRNQYDAVLSLLTDEIDKEVIDVMKQSGVRIISQFAVGFNNIDIEYAEEKGIAVCNTSASSGAEVAEHSIALMIALNHKLIEMDTFVRKGKYKGWDPMLLRGPSLRGKTIGIVGAGAIGTHTAKIAHCLGMRVIYFDIKQSSKIERVLEAEFVPDLDDLMRRSDVVSVHAPLNKNTHHLISKERIGLMKKSALLINTSRGAVVDEKALVSALQLKQICGAGLDVFENEPKLARGLAKLSNVILTPHIASATKMNREQMAQVVTQNIIDFFEKGYSKNQVN